MVKTEYACVCCKTKRVRLEGRNYCMPDDKVVCSECGVKMQKISEALMSENDVKNLINENEIVAESFFDEVYKQFDSYEEPFDDRVRALIRALNEGDANGVLIALTGWSFTALTEFAKLTYCETEE